MRVLLLVVLMFCTKNVSAQKPADSLYTYKISFEEWGGKSLGASCTVSIKGDSITLIHDGSNLSGKKGDILDKGILMKHVGTGKWIIASDPKDIYALEIGACSGGPTVIDFSRKVVWFC